MIEIWQIIEGYHIAIILRAPTSNCEISKYVQRAVGPFSHESAHMEINDSEMYFCVFGGQGM